MLATLMLLRFDTENLMAQIKTHKIPFCADCVS